MPPLTRSGNVNGTPSTLSFSSSAARQNSAYCWPPGPADCGMSQGWGLVVVRVEQPGIGHTGVGRGVGEEGEGKGDGTLPTPHSMRAAPPTDLANLVCQSPRQSK